MTKENKKTVKDKDSSSDDKLMVRLQAGDMSALGDIYERYRTMVHIAVGRAVPNIIAADKEELVQDIFIMLSQLASNFDITKPLKPWLYGISYKKAQNFRRKTWLRTKLLERRNKEVITLCQNDHSNATHALETRQTLEQAFAALPPAHYEIMVLHSVEGFKGQEIAQILNIELNTVWTRLHRARAHINKSFAAANGK